MRILVTGKNGQLGQSINKLVNIEAKNKHNPNSNEFIFVGREELDLSSKGSIDNYFNNNDKFDIIINCASYTAVEKAEKEKEVANQVNYLAVKQIAKIAAKKHIKLIHISTDYVFDGNSNTPYTENDKANPINTYGKTKLAGERAVLELMENNAIVIRTSWIYSEYGKNFVKTILQLSKKKNELSIINDQIGSPTYAGDLADTILIIVNSKKYKSKKQKTRVYNFSGAGECSWYCFAKEVFRIVKTSCNVKGITTEQYNSNLERPKYSVLNNNIIQEDFGVESKYWKESLRKFLKNNY